MNEPTQKETRTHVRIVEGASANYQLACNMNELTRERSRMRANIVISVTCMYCGKCFKRSSDCKRHERTHTGETVYMRVL